MKALGYFMRTPPKKLCCKNMKIDSHLICLNQWIFGKSECFIRFKSPCRVYQTNTSPIIAVIYVRGYRLHNHTFGNIWRYCCTGSLVKRNREMTSTTMKLSIIEWPEKNLNCHLITGLVCNTIKNTQTVSQTNTLWVVVTRQKFM